jgi:hypothetical protein
MINFKEQVALFSRVALRAALLDRAMGRTGPHVNE